MCGIAGIFGPSATKFFPLTALKHRGPDDEGKWADPNNNIWLGQTRLSILDLSEKGHQPMKCVEGRYQIVFNGEIYNFVELKEELESKGYRFKSASDTEIIPAAYDCWGVDCLHRFNGMWAFAIWDTHKKELWLARDRFGKKPLTSLRGGADQWDNPRYRTILFLWQAILAGHVWFWWRETRDPWPGRVVAMEVVFLSFFGQWYANRYFHLGKQLPFGEMVGIILGMWILIILWGVWRDRSRGAGPGV